MANENILTLRQADQARTDFALVESNLELIMAQVARIPTRKEQARKHARDHLRDGNPDYAGGFVVHRVLALLLVTRAGPIIVAVIAALISAPLSAREHRSREVTWEFQRKHPCPSNGKTSGACPGYRKDHIKALACGGPDTLSNIQWQTIAAARAKDRWSVGRVLGNG